MKIHTQIRKSVLATFVGRGILSLGACASSPQMSKPKGATGTGNIAAGTPKSNQFWWPEQLDLSPLRDHDRRSNPLDTDFNYADAFNTLDMAVLKKTWMSCSPHLKIGGLQTGGTTAHCSFA